MLGIEPTTFAFPFKCLQHSTTTPLHDNDDNQHKHCYLIYLTILEELRTKLLGGDIETGNGITMQEGHVEYSH